jgi:hypothetical protein
MKRPYSTMLSFLFVLILAASCSQNRPSAPAWSSLTPSSTAMTQSSPTRIAHQGQVYIDAKLGFRLIVPRTWQALPQPGSQASLNNTAVTFTVDEQHTHALVLIGVFYGKTMPSAFAERGTPTTHLGPYPAFVADRTLGEARAPCLVRIFLAGDDYVLADWCAPDAFAFRVPFEQVLATYQPASPSFVPRTTVPPQPQTCAGLQRQLGYADVSWGRQLASPTSTRWKQVPSGAFICSNENSADWYLFQCTELVNRLLYERWALPHLPGNAARYYDYYQDGVLHPGTIRTFPADSYQLSNDASQGNSAFRPVVGDILVFQDVKDPQAGWTGIFSALHLRTGSAAKGESSRRADRCRISARGSHRWWRSVCSSRNVC